jgi:pSer/pThr/pTyr-binding forkhead associated (FHA) protein
VIQIQVLSGKQAGSDIAARRFPFTIGRAAGDSARLEDPGVWERHLEIRYERGGSFTFVAAPGATMLVNGEKSGAGSLKNGDLLEIGAVRLRFWLAPTRQKTMRFREVATWSALVGLLGLQIALIYRLLR